MKWNAKHIIGHGNTMDAVQVQVEIAVRVYSSADTADIESAIAAADALIAEAVRTINARAVERRNAQEVVVTLDNTL